MKALHAFTGSPGSPRDLDVLAQPLEKRGIRLIPTEIVPEGASHILGFSFGCVMAMEALRRNPAGLAILVSPFLQLRTLSPLARALWRSPLAILAIRPLRTRILGRHLLTASGGDHIPTDLSRLVLGYDARELCRSQIAKHRTADQVREAHRRWSQDAPRASIIGGAVDPLRRCPDLPWRDIITLDGAGHFLPWTRTEVLVDRIAHFVPPEDFE